MNSLSTIKYIFLHTEGAPANSFGTVDSIRRYHKSLGWSDIGYHFLVSNKGKVDTGRAIKFQGAHTAGINHISIGVSMAGNHDLAPPSEAQYKATIEFLAKLAKEHNIPVNRILGHREVNILIKQGKVDKKYTTPKTCPGKYVDMDKVRMDVCALICKEVG